MDPAGARALARRLADGKAPDGATLDEQPAAEARRVKSESGDPEVVLPPALQENGVIYVRPTRRSAQQDVWIYVRASDGRLRRLR